MLQEPVDACRLPALTFYVAMLDTVLHEEFVRRHP